MTRVLALLSVFFAAACAHGRCYESEPLCLDGNTRCTWDTEQKCRVCTCVPSAQTLEGPAANSKPSP